MGLDTKGTIGIKKKVLSEISTLQNELNTQVDYIWRQNDHVFTNIKNLKSKNLRRGSDSINDYVYKNVDLSVYNKSYIRFGRFSIRFLKLLKILRKNSIYTVVEIPTFPFIKEDYLALVNKIKKLQFLQAAKVINKLLANCFLAYLAKGKINRIATYSNDKLIWGIKTLNISNGIEILPWTQKENSYEIDKNINMICVSSCVKWHGYDRLIKGLNNYYRSKNIDFNVNLFIVGDGPETCVYKDMIKEYNLEEHVFMMGCLYGDQLNDLYSKCDIAIDSLGRHRVGVYYNSSLKGKEYTERGLPIVSGVKTEFDMDKEYPFYYRVPADESDVNINDILSFYETVRSYSNYCLMIREYAIENFSFKTAMKSVLDYYKD